MSETRPYHLLAQDIRSVSLLGRSNAAAGTWRRGQDWFRRAIDLNPENLAAHINLEYAERNPAADKPLSTVRHSNEFSDLFAKYNNWREILQANGPVDEPSFLFRTGRMFLAGGNSTQAIEEFARCVELAPDWPPQLWLARSYVQSWDFATALEVTDACRFRRTSGWTRL